MKKFLSLALVFVMLFSLAACGGKDEGADSKPSGGSSSEVSQKPEQPEQPSSSVGNEQNEEPGDSSEEPSNTPIEEPPVSSGGSKDAKLLYSVSDEDLDVTSLGQVTMDESVIYDKDGITVTATNLEVTTGTFLAEHKIMMTVVNNTDKNIKVSSDNVVINDWCIEGGDAYISSDVINAGETSEVFLRVDSYLLARYGIGAVQCVRFDLLVMDDEYDMLDTVEGIVINFKGGESAQSVDWDTSNCNVVYAKNGIQVTYLGMEKDYYGGVNLYFYCENSSAQVASIYSDNETVDGEDSFFGGISADLQAGTQGVEEIMLFESDLQKLGVDEPSEIALDLIIDNESVGNFVISTK